MWKKYKSVKSDQKKGVDFRNVEIWRYISHMARQKRNVRDNSYYHIVNRGVEKRTVYLCASDYCKFLELLERACEKYSVEIVAFCFMPNHYHIIIKSIKGKDVSLWAKWFQGMYAQWFNRRYGRVGPLWQGRFFSKEVGGGEHLAKTWMYVVQNPVKASLSRTPKQWRWSSAWLRNHGIQPPYLVEPDWWWTSLKPRWWSDDMLAYKELIKVRTSLKRSVVEELETPWELPESV